MLDERALQRMPAAQALDRRDSRASHMGDRHQTGVHGLAVDQHRARAALAFAASFLRAGQTAVFAQHIEQALHRMRVSRYNALAVQRETHRSP